MSIFRKKPVEVEALQWTGDNLAAILAFGEKDIRAVDSKGWFNHAEQFNPKEVKALMIHTLEGVMTASLNDWVVRGTKGEFYSVKPDIFEESYEATGE